MGIPRRAWLPALTVVTGCHPAVRPDPPVAAPPRASDAPASAPAPGSAVPAVPARFADADLLAFVGGDLVGFDLAGDRLTELGRMRFQVPDEMAQFHGDWADPDTFFVAWGAMFADDVELAAITAEGVRPVARPPASALTAERPTDGSNDDELQEGGVEGGLVVTEGAAWWTHCAWSLPYDGGVCERWIAVRLWPSPAREVGAPPVARAWAWWDEPPPGVTATSKDDTVLCTQRVGRRATTVALFPADENEHLDQQHWLSADPPRLLTVWGGYGLADLIPSRWQLHDGCVAEPAVVAERAAPGPDRLWVAWEYDPADPSEERPTRAVVRRGAVVLGTLPEHTDDVRFRPPRP